MCREHEIDVPAKITAASDIFEKRLEVYAPQLPVGVNIRADQLQSALSGYFFAFLNDDESLREYRNTVSSTDQLQCKSDKFGAENRSDSRPVFVCEVTPSSSPSTRL